MPLFLFDLKLTRRKIMATWNIYAEVSGSPLYATMEMDWTDENRAFETIMDEFRSTLQIDLVED